MAIVNEGDVNDSPYCYQTMSLTDDQKVMEQSGYCHLYQDIDSEYNEVYRYNNDAISDDYECIEEIKAAHKSSASDNDATNLETESEWRVLSRLELQDIGEDWRIVSTIPRNGNEPAAAWQPWGGRKVKDGTVESKHLSIMVTNNVDNVTSPECVNTAKSFFGKVLTKNSEDLYLREDAEGEADEAAIVPDSPDNHSAHGIWLRKQVTFGKWGKHMVNSFKYFDKGGQRLPLAFEKALALIQKIFEKYLE